MDLVVQQGEPRGWRLLSFGAQGLLESPDPVRSCQAHATLLILLSVRHASNQGSFPPRRFCCPPGADGTMSPSDFPRGSTLMMERGARLAAWDLPCCPVCGADVPRPLPRGERIYGYRSGAPMDSSGLPGYAGRSALATSRSRPAQASHLLRPVDSLTHPRWASVPRASVGQLPLRLPRSRLGCPDNSPDRTCTCETHRAFSQRTE